MEESFRLLGQAQKAANEEWDAMARGIFGLLERGNRRQMRDGTHEAEI